MESTGAPAVRIVQIVPEVRVGSGVESVAFHLEQEWRALGVETARFTLADAAGSWLPTPGPGVGGKLTLAARVVWFSTVGTFLARRMLSRQPAGTVSICHNDVLAGDIYVNHGVVAAAMKARGNQLVRMLRNPVHLFVWLRDSLRFAGGTHRVVVNLCESEATALSQTYRRIRPRAAIVGNGVDIDRYRPDSTARTQVRHELGIPQTANVGLFVGHEFSRKGLPLTLNAMTELPNFQLVVVGGTPEMVAAAQAEARALDVAERVIFVGRQPDPRRYFQASDVFVFPSAYEAYPLVVLEALACGLPVVATPVGSVPEVIHDGVSGVIVEPEPGIVAEGIRRTLMADRQSQSLSARSAAESRSWATVAEQYLQLCRSVHGGT